MKEKFDAIVVGAGPSGNAAAYTMAKAGLKVLQIERGEYAGSKNVQGAILYADALEKIIPDFREDAPLERHIVEQRMWVLDDDSFVGSHFRSDDYNKPPFNRYTILRAQFDKWFSQKVREAGALLICETTVEHLLMDGKRVVGVRCDREGGDVFADVVVLADGVNSTLARKAGFHPEIAGKNVALAVKEILFLPEETLQARFNVKEDEGVVIEMVGKITEGMVGTCFLYTNKDSLTIGVGCILEDFKSRNPNRSAPYALLEKLKRHPAVAPLIEGAEMKEYCAHLIPEGGFFAVPQIYGDGWLIVGDSGGFVNAAHREGSNLAMTTGRLAGETIVEARRAGTPMSAATLKAYKTKVDQSFVMKDLHKYRHLPDVLHRNNQFFTSYPELVNKAAKTLFTVDGADKTSKEREIRTSFRASRSLVGLMTDAYKLWRATR
jgi:electron transfer flavoprotein-quinone oxidoreductase